MMVKVRENNKQRVCDGEGVREQHRKSATVRARDQDGEKV